MQKKRYVFGLFLIVVLVTTIIYQAAPAGPRPWSPRTQFCCELRLQMPDSLHHNHLFTLPMYKRQYTTPWLLSKVDTNLASGV